jgi:hypothetical protein
MSDLRELTLNIVGGGLKNPRPRPIGIKLIEEIIIDILKFLEPNSGRQQQARY